LGVNWGISAAGGLRRGAERELPFGFFFFFLFQREKKRKVEKGLADSCGQKRETNTHAWGGDRREGGG